MGNQKRKAEVTARTRRRRALLVLALLVVGVAGAAAYFLSRQEASTPAASAANAAEAFAGGEATLLYADFSSGSELHALDLGNRDAQVVGTLTPQGNTLAAPGSTWLSVEAGVASDDGGIVPGIFLFDPSSGDEIELGVGVDPLWSPDGSLVAWRQPADVSNCGEEQCRGDMNIVVTDPSTGEATPWTDPGRFSLRGWAGTYLIVQEDQPSGDAVLHSVSVSGEMQQLPLLPIDFWEASPDGRWLVQTGDNYNRFLKMADGQITGEGAEFGIPSGTKLGTGAWAHDSSRVAAFAVGESGELELVVFGPGDPEPSVLTEGGEAGNGAVFWTPDNDGVVFQRFNGQELEAVHCRLDAMCNVVLSWTTGISLLRVE